ncbi:dihydrofolate reductase [Kribbella voronezhensis]|uniref:Dihydrofolate reductase n=1 Tax=Kribbella voronezhensis TaxID=2512212 RepID=A0A4R7T7J7_9ACTN|nr:dihydrofolate reductase family protein [Kribbella voronezhensis]TDU87735.1 dihydrofolate reductase [Kribbella voronezhensis]
MTTRTEPRTGKVLWHFMMSLDGFIAAPGQDALGWLEGVSIRPGVVAEYADRIGAVLGGRKGWDAYPDSSAPYGGAMGGPTFILTHHPEDAKADQAGSGPGVTFLNCEVAEATRIALKAAGGKDLVVFSADIGRQLLEQGLLDELHLHIAPILLGDGTRLFDNPAGVPIQLERLTGDNLRASVDVTYRPVRPNEANPQRATDRE